jgi:hypothetical protein
MTLQLITASAAIQRTSSFMRAVLFTATGAGPLLEIYVWRKRAIEEEKEAEPIGTRSKTRCDVQ